MNPNIPGAIRLAVGDGDVDAVRSWLAAGGDAFVNDVVATVDGHSELLYLATTSRANRGSAMAQLLLDFGARPAVINVIKAIGSDNMETVRLLLARGADMRERYGTWTALHFVTLAGELRSWTLRHGQRMADQGECFRLLLDAGASVHAVKEASLETPLMLAAEKGFTSPVALKLLLKYGSDVDAVDAQGFTAEDHARAALGLPVWHDPHAPTRLSEHSCGLWRGAGVVEGSLAILRDFRAAGKDWKRYANEPRKQLLVLRRLVERGRAAPPDGTLARVQGLPDVLFWKVLAFWRSDRDV